MMKSITINQHTQQVNASLTPPPANAHIIATKYNFGGDAGSPDVLCRSGGLNGQKIPSAHRPSRKIAAAEKRGWPARAACLRAPCALREKKSLRGSPPAEIETQK